MKTLEFLESVKSEGGQQMCSCSWNFPSGVTKCRVARAT